jgi:hypothetical protein
MRTRPGYPRRRPVLLCGGWEGGVKLGLGGWGTGVGIVSRGFVCVCVCVCT